MSKKYSSDQSTLKFDLKSNNSTKNYSIESFVHHLEKYSKETNLIWPKKDNKQNFFENWHQIQAQTSTDHNCQASNSNPSFLQRQTFKKKSSCSENKGWK